MAEPGGRSWPGDAPDAAVTAALDVLVPLGRAVRPGAPLGALTTYRVGGAAAVLVSAGSEADLAVVGAAVNRSGLPVLVVGRGSNLLVADRGFGGIAVQLDPDRFGAIAGSDGPGAGRDGGEGGRELRAGAAVALPTLARRSVEAGLTGLEWAVGVPGSVGGGVRMNAGGHGSDIARTLGWCRVADLGGPDPGSIRRLDRAELGYGYRRSAIEPHQVVIEAGFDLRPGDAEAGRAAIREIVRWRREHQPGGQNAGSVFTNPGGAPPADSAGWLIDTAGLKGLRVGTAEVSAKHANFIQADPGGRAGDVLELVRRIQDEVLRRHGVELHPELRLVGFGPAGGGTGEIAHRQIKRSTGG